MLLKNYVLKAIIFCCKCDILTYRRLTLGNIHLYLQWQAPALLDIVISHLYFRPCLRRHLPREYIKELSSHKSYNLMYVILEVYARTHANSPQPIYMKNDDIPSLELVIFLGIHMNNVWHRKLPILWYDFLLWCNSIIICRKQICNMSLFSFGQNIYTRMADIYVLYVWYV